MSARWWLLGLSCLLGAGSGMAVAWHLRPAQQPAFASTPVVATAGTPAPAMREITSVDALTRLAAEHPGGVLVDFHAQWCAPCRALAPRLEALAQRHPQLLVVGIDAASYPAVADAYSVDALPALVHLVQGKEVARQVGAPSELELERWLGLDAPAVAAPMSAPNVHL